MHLYVGPSATRDTGTIDLLGRLTVIVCVFPDWMYVVERMHASSVRPLPLKRSLRLRRRPAYRLHITGMTQKILPSRWYLPPTLDTREPPMDDGRGCRTSRTLILRRPANLSPPFELPNASALTTSFLSHCAQRGKKGGAYGRVSRAHTPLLLRV